MNTLIKLLIGIVVVVVISFVVWKLRGLNIWLRGRALVDALQTIGEKKDSEQSCIANVILINYREIRGYTRTWSTVYWGCTFCAAIFSATAGLILQFENLGDQQLMKDVAAALSVAAALLVTISTSGGFQYKWQANRVAAADLERLGYEFLGNELEKKSDDPRSYLSSVKETLYRRHLAIIGSPDKGAPTSPAEQGSGGQK